MTHPDPHWDPQVRQRAMDAFNDVLAVAETHDDPTSRDVVRRNCDSTGLLELPDPLPFGDVTGLLRFGELRILDRLQAVADEPLQDAVTEARRLVAEIRAAVDAYQRGRFGDRWNPPQPGEAA